MASRARIAHEVSYSWCKTFGHSWGDAPPSWPSTVKQGFVLRCERCYTVRHDHVDNLGAVKRHYDYPDDYRQIGVKLSKAELRLAELKARKRKRLTVVG